MAENDKSSETENDKKKSDNKEPDISTKEKITEKTGYEPTDILKAPIESPDLKKAKKPTELQQIIFGVGVVIIILGAILWAAVGFWTGIVIGFIGVVVAATGIMVRFDTA